MANTMAICRIKFLMIGRKATRNAGGSRAQQAQSSLGASHAGPAPESFDPRTIING